MLSQEERALITNAHNCLVILTHSDHLTAEDNAALTHLISIKEPRRSTINLRSTESSPDFKGQNIDKKV